MVKTIIGLTAQWVDKSNMFEAWIVTPTKTGTGRKPWRMLKKVFSPEGAFAKYNPRVDEIESSVLVNNVSIRVRPGKGSDSGVLEGDALHFLGEDESGNSYMTEDIRDSLLPAISRVNGIQMYIGTAPTPFPWG